MTLDVRRINKELINLEDPNQEPKFIVIRQNVDDVLAPFQVRFLAPENTIYYPGFYQVTIELSSVYPFRPPTIKFDTTIYHPNISSQTGYICLDILKTTWSPILTLRTTMLSIIALLSSPEPNDPQDAEVASQYLRDRDLFNTTAQYHVEVFALPISQDIQLIPDTLIEKLRSFTSTKKNDSELRQILLENKLDLNVTINELLS